MRKKAELTQTELAERLGTTQSSIARLEAGERSPTVKMLERIA
ncbi:helix-turn-helix domain-containing protein [Saccharibacter sp. 17.LH.SD]|nr:helix-turn-helix transcriptional regulator [Saccharibacter sp. 17.LH.SD]MXV44291.1 helix-turn-helix domain-containing protein [Saccharibacter sp. 17.LH.SD]